MRAISGGAGVSTGGMTEVQDTGGMTRGARVVTVGMTGISYVVLVHRQSACIFHWLQLPL